MNETIKLAQRLDQLSWNTSQHLYPVVGVWLINTLTQLETTEFKPSNETITMSPIEFVDKLLTVGGELNLDKPKELKKYIYNQLEEAADTFFKIEPNMTKHLTKKEYTAKKIKKIHTENINRWLRECFRDSSSYPYGWDIDVDYDFIHEFIEHIRSSDNVILHDYN